MVAALLLCLSLQTTHRNRAAALLLQVKKFSAENQKSLALC
jgi:hypothetical protein